jgi:mannose-6-phosphate isomerase-like protein (cupin superfamily)
MRAMSDYTAKCINDMEGSFGGAMKKARAELGVSSFGMQVIDLPPNFNDYPEHDHSEDGQEEVYGVMRGSGQIEVDGERIEIDQDTLVRVGPTSRRKVYAGPEGLRLIALGAIPGGAYTINPRTELGAS